MSPTPARTSEGEAATDVILGTFRANGLLLTAGDLLAAEEGLTAARWQVIGAVALAARPLTVPQIARRTGLTRQAVQASVNRLLSAGLVSADVNLDHRRSPLIALTERGGTTCAALQQRQTSWINELAAGLKRSELATAARVLQQLSERLVTNARKRRKGEVRTMQLRELDEQVTYLQQLQEDDGQVVLINHFNVAPEDVDRFLEVWADDAAFMKQQAGFISTQLHRGTAGSSTFVNVAVWESARALGQAFRSPEFQQRTARYPEDAVAAPHVFKKVAVPGICVA